MVPVIKPELLMPRPLGKPLAVKLLASALGSLICKLIEAPTGLVCVPGFTSDALFTFQVKVTDSVVPFSVSLTVVL